MRTQKGSVYLERRGEGSLHCAENGLFPPLLNKMTSSQGLWWRGEEGVAKQLTLTHPFREQHCTKLHGQTKALISLHEPPDNSHYCMHVHLCGAHTLNYKTITFVLSFPLSTWTDATKCREHFFCCYISQVKHRSAHSQLEEIYCSLHNQLPCDTYLCCKRLFSFYSPPYLSLAAMYISCNYNSYWFHPIVLQHPADSVV